MEKQVQCQGKLENIENKQQKQTLYLLGHTVEMSGGRYRNIISNFVRFLFLFPTQMHNTHRISLN